MVQRKDIYSFPKKEDDKHSEQEPLKYESFECVKARLEQTTFEAEVF
jgi:hypothetical protein